MKIDTKILILALLDYKEIIEFNNDNFLSTSKNQDQLKKEATYNKKGRGFLDLKRESNSISIPLGVVMKKITQEEI